MSDHGAVDLFLNDATNKLDEANRHDYGSPESVLAIWHAVLCLQRAIRALAERKQPAADEYLAKMLFIAQGDLGKLIARIEKAKTILKTIMAGHPTDKTINDAIGVLEGLE
jgi:hypothetical protein